MRSPVVALAAIVGVIGTAKAQSASPVVGSGGHEFQIEQSHSTVGFSIGFVGLPIRGTFDDVSGTILYVAGRPEASSVTVSIATASIHTGSEHRDGHLKSSDFLDTAKYPMMVFQSTGVEKRGGSLIMRGILQLHGVTRPISLTFSEAEGSPIDEPHGATLVQFAGRTRIARKDFGIVGGSTYNSWFDAIRQSAMADSIDIDLEVTAWDPDYSRNHKYDKPLAYIEKNGIQATLDRLHRMKSVTPDSLSGAEWDLTQMAHALMQRGKYADAAQLLTATAEIFPKSADVESALARAYELEGDRARAMAHTSAALALDPYLPRALELRRRLGSSL